jgi:hypothetical protein
VHPDLEVTEFGEFQFSVLDPEARFLGVGDAIVAAFRLEPGITGLAILLLHAEEEALKRTFHPEEDILQNLGVDFIEEKYAMFVGRKDLLLADPGQSFPGLLVVVFPIYQAGVIKDTADFKGGQ